MSADRLALAQSHRLVVKLGTQVVTHNGVELALGRLMSLVESLARLRLAGLDVVLVSSGAVGMGMRQLGLTERPRSLGLRQACAAVGQGHLMAMYARAFGDLGVTAAQVLLTQEDLGDRDRALCVRTTLMRLLELGTIPVINENDSVSVRELMEHQRRGAETSDDRPVFGDNDGLSALVATALDADLLVMLTDVAGLYDKNPKAHPEAVRIAELEVVDDESLASAAGVSAGGTGGMASKLEAARVATAEGTSVVIASGNEPRIVERLLAGEDLGTLVRPRERRGPRWRHIAVSGRRRGAVVVNEGALRALVEHKASLLPIGVVGVEGDFGKGDLVEIRDASGRIHGRGLVNYDALSCRALLGRHSDDIGQVLGFRTYDAIITRDNLVMGSL
ncbi:MAG: glutamate 5-kinase [Myxococcales bacterium]|nr:glutamate 5-kinase [Myxococcales bacterium]